VLGIPGWRVWLGYRDGVPAGAAYTYHDGSSLGVYQLGTLPEHRGHGVAQAIMAAIVRAYPDEIVTLSATDQGRHLYTQMGFEVSSGAVWWRPSHTGDDSGEGLR
jgi:GNAT superfamily N-acetyltransferase